MTPQYLMFTALQWLAPAAVLVVVATAVVAAIKRPAVWSIAYCVAACFLFFGMVANHLALNTFGTQEFTPDGDPFTRFEPILRFVGLLSQLVGFTACFVGSFAAIRLLTAANRSGVTASSSTSADVTSTQV